MVAGGQEEGSLADDLARALDSGEGADLTLVAGGARMRVHSFLLCARSPVFADLLGYGASGPSSSSLELDGLEEEVARQLLRFLYTDRAPQLARLAPQLLAASDAYDLPLLRRRCEQQLVKSLTVENAAAAVVLALRHDCPQLKERAVYFIRAHPLDVMATESWQRDLCTDPEMVTEVSRLIAAPAPAQLLSELSGPAGALSSRSTGSASSERSSSGHSSGSGAGPAPPPTPRYSLPSKGGAGAAAHVWSLSGEELCARLLESAQKGSVEDLQTLLAAGVDVGLRDEGKTTALHYAACNGHLDAARCLLEHGADANARDQNRDTPLHWAAGRGHAAVVQLLAAAQADPNARGKYGMTPLHWAALCGHADAAARLLEAGAFLGARDDCGSTPLDLIRRANHLDMVEMLS